MFGHGQLRVTPDRHFRMILAGMTGATVTQNQGFLNRAQDFIPVYLRSYVLCSRRGAERAEKSPEINLRVSASPRGNETFKPSQVYNACRGLSRDYVQTVYSRRLKALQAAEVWI